MSCQRHQPAVLAVAAVCLLASAASAPAARHGGAGRAVPAPAPPPLAARTVPGDLCDAPASLPRGGTLTVDLCDAWNDYDPGAFGCSPCALPGPDVVAAIDTQPGEDLHIDLAVTGTADVRLYLATDCDDPVGSCLLASDAAGEALATTLAQGGTIYLYVDTTGECAEVTLTRYQAASTTRTDLTTLKAIYR